MKTGVMLCGHGSRDAEAIDGVRAAGGAACARGCPSADSRPAISNSRGRSSATGSRRWRRAARGASWRCRACCSPRATSRTTCRGRSTASPPSIPALELRFGRELAIEPKLLAGRGRPHRARRASGAAPIARADTLLVVVGRGTNDPDANSNIAKLARMLWEGMGFGWAEAAFSGVAQPLVEPALSARAAAGLSAHHRLSLFPLHRRLGEAHLRRRRPRRGRSSRTSNSSRRPICATIRWCSTASPTASSEVADGEPAMNCRLCKYRTQIDRLREPPPERRRRAHHHHVRGIGTDAEHGHHHHHHHHHHNASSDGGE